jgi:hypothetical protein
MLGWRRKEPSLSWAEANALIRLLMRIDANLEELLRRLEDEEEDRG